MTEESNAQWLAPSDVGNEFMRHAEAMELCAEVPIGKSFAIPPGYNVGILRKMTADFKPKKIVVIEHNEGGFEVRRLKDNANIKLFYASIAIAESDPEAMLSDSDLKKFKIVNVIKSFLSSDDFKIAKYDKKGPDFKKEGIISSSYINRRLTATSVFRTDPMGANDAIKKTIRLLENDNVLEEVDRQAAINLFNTTAVLYKINKQAIENE